jgi:hypothetical protein
VVEARDRASTAPQPTRTLLTSATTLPRTNRQLPTAERRAPSVLHRPRGECSSFSLMSVTYRAQLVLLGVEPPPSRACGCPADAVLPSCRAHRLPLLQTSFFSRRHCYPAPARLLSEIPCA